MAAYSSLVSFITFFLFATGKCERTKDKMYVPLDGAFCFRRLTATQQYGCSSSAKGDVGVIHFIESRADIDFIVKAGDAGPYVPVVPLKDFKRTDMIKLRDSGKVSGMLLYKNGSLNSFSSDDTCPNRRSGFAEEACDVTDAWNPVGTGLFFEDWGFPIAYVQELATITKLRECFLKFNADLTGQQDRPLCAVQLQSYMMAAVNTLTCIRRGAAGGILVPVKLCDPLGDYNVHLFTQPSATNDERSVILATARLDAASMFDGLVPGAMSPITSIVTLLTASSYLKDMDAYLSPTSKQLVFMLFNGEAFDYIGSSRIVFDIQQGVFPSKEKPLSLNQIGLIVELDQLSGNNLFYHSRSSSTPVVAKFVETLSAALGQFGVKLNQTQGKLPPASLQRFLRADPDIPSLVLSNYDTSYTNPFYNSIMDDESFLGYVYGNGSQPTSEIQSKISQMSMSLARGLYTLLHDKPYYKPLEDKTELVDELLHCYLESLNCSFFRNVSNNASLPATPAPLYVGVHGNNNTITRLTGLTLAYLTGTEIPANKSECRNRTLPGMQYIWMNNKCVETAVSYSVAYSPAFQIMGYNWTSNSYSTWTESIWRELGMRMFLKPAWKHEVLNITTGLLILVVSFIAVYFVNAKSDILFNRVVLRSTEGAW